MSATSLAVLLSCLVSTAYFKRQLLPVAGPESVMHITSLQAIPEKNQQILRLIKRKGASFAPTYESAVCTEFLIKVIVPFTPLSKSEMNAIRILTKEPLSTLIEKDAPVIKGVQTALEKSGKGIRIDIVENVKPGDFVQFWNSWFGYPWGHCGVVVSLVPHKSITMYSSHPNTNGFGKQTFLWPEKTYFVRLN